jgi:hypothetical protein
MHAAAMRWTYGMLFGLGWLLACGDDGKATDAPSSSEEDGSISGGGNRDAGRIDAGIRDAGRNTNDAGGEGCLDDAREEHFPDAGSMHVSRTRDSELIYDDHPPSGGTHSECWADFGIYEAELKTGRWVHNLEHGGVTLLYRCEDGCPDEVAALKAFVQTHPRTILTPYARLPTRFAVVAWEYRLLNDCLDLPAFEQFYSDHFNKAREDIAGGPPDICR